MDQSPTSAGPSAPSPEAKRRRALLIWGAVAAAVVAALVVWLIVRGGDDDQPSASSSLGTPQIRNENELREYGRSQSTPVYWAGPRKNARYELTRTTDGRTYIRYLTGDAKTGDERPDFLTVGTYPQKNAYTAVRTAGRRPGYSAVKTQSGALVVARRQKPTSVYFAFPGTAFQVEVFAPAAGHARSLVLGGQVERLD